MASNYCGSRQLRGIRAGQSIQGSRQEVAVSRQKRFALSATFCRLFASHRVAEGSISRRKHATVIALVRPTLPARQGPSDRRRREAHSAGIQSLDSGEPESAARYAARNENSDGKACATRGFRDRRRSLTSLVRLKPDTTVAP